MGNGHIGILVVSTLGRWKNKSHLSQISLFLYLLNFSHKKWFVANPVNCQRDRFLSRTAWGTDRFLGGDFVGNVEEIHVNCCLFLNSPISTNSVTSSDLSPHGSSVKWRVFPTHSEGGTDQYLGGDFVGKVEEICHFSLIPPQVRSLQVTYFPMGHLSNGKFLHHRLQAGQIGILVVTLLVR